MGILCDYFAAPSDEEAASVVDTGPRVGSSEPRFATVDAKGIDPLSSAVARRTDTSASPSEVRRADRCDAQP